MSLPSKTPASHPASHKEGRAPELGNLFAFKPARVCCVKSKYGFVGGKKRFQLCFVRNFPRGNETSCVHSPKREPRRGLPCGGTQGGAREPSWRFLRTLVYEVLSRAPLSKHTGRAKGSSQNVRHKQPIRHPLLEASAALTDWTQRAGGGCHRSLAHLAAG
jgi:hypothetical protein